MPKGQTEFTGTERKLLTLNHRLAKVAEQTQKAVAELMAKRPKGKGKSKGVGYRGPTKSR